MIGVVRAVRAKGFGQSLRTHRALMSEELCVDYTVAQWISDHEVDRESRSFFRTLATKAPYIEDSIERYEADKAVAYECRVAGARCDGAGFAYLFDCPAVACRGDPRFEQSIVLVDVTRIGEEGDLVDETYEMCSLATVDHVRERSAWLINRVNAELSDGEALLRTAPAALPFLRFGATATKQVKGLTGGEPFFRQVLRHLRALNDAAEIWDGGQLLPLGITFSDESQATLQNAALRARRTFPCSDGMRRLFHLHSKPTGGNVRIYFLATNPTTPTVEIGYIGPHPKSAKYG